MKITSLLTDSGKISENIATEGSCVVKKEKKISHVAGKDKGPFSNFFFFFCKARMQISMIRTKITINVREQKWKQKAIKT